MVLLSKFPKILKLLIKIVGSLVISYLLLLLIERSVDFGLRNNNNLKITFANKKSRTADYLIHGPCEALFSINPSLLFTHDSLYSWNAAERHTDFADNFLQLYLYLKKHPSLKLVALYVTPESFDERFNTFHSYKYAPYLSDPTVKAVVKNMDPYLIKYDCIPMFKYTYYNRYKNWEALQGFKHYFKRDVIPYFENGYETHENTSFTIGKSGYTLPQNLIYANFVPKSQLNNQVYFNQYAHNEKFIWSIQREQFLVHLIQLCKQKGIKIVLFESPTYTPSMKTQLNRVDFLHKINRIAQQNTIPFWQFNLPLISNNINNFVSPLILSKQGSEVFSPYFSKKIKQELLK